MSKYKAYFAIEKKLNVVSKHLSREELILQFTDDRKDSLRELTPFEYKEFLKWIETTFKPVSNDWQNTPENKMRRKIIAIFKEMHYTKADGTADMQKINMWCIKFSITHKPLNDNTKAQLIQIVSQAENVKKSFIKSLNQ